VMKCLQHLCLLLQLAGHRFIVQGFHGGLAAAQLVELAGLSVLLLLVLLLSMLFGGLCPPPVPSGGVLPGPICLSRSSRLSGTRQRPRSTSGPGQPGRALQAVHCQLGGVLGAEACPAVMYCRGRPGVGKGPWALWPALNHSAFYPLAPNNEGRLKGMGL